MSPSRVYCDGSSSDGSSGGSCEQSPSAAAAAASLERLWRGAPYRSWAERRAPELKRLLRRGCPPALRPDVWLHASGGAALAAAAPLDYTSLLAAAQLPARRRSSSAGGGSGRSSASGCDDGSAAGSRRCSDASSGDGGCDGPADADAGPYCIGDEAWVWISEEAATRSLPKHLAARLMALPGGPAALRRVLAARAARGGGGALWRGAGAVAALALVVVQDEAAAFWVVEALCASLFGHCGGQAQHGVAVEARAMALLITAKLPRVASHLAGDLGFPAHELAAPWVATCFAGALGSVEASARAWDCLLFEGPKVLHRIALAVLSRFQGAVLACSRAPGLPRLLERSCASAAAAGAAGRRGGGEGAVVEAGFRRVGGLPGAKLAALRAAAAADVERRAAERRRHMELVLGRPSSA